MGAVKRFGNRSSSGTAGSGMGVNSCNSGNNPGEGGRDSGAGDGMVATRALTTGSGRGSARMASVHTCPQGLYPRCLWTKLSWVGAGRRFSWLSR